MGSKANEPLSIMEKSFAIEAEYASVARLFVDGLSRPAFAGRFFVRKYRIKTKIVRKTYGFLPGIVVEWRRFSRGMFAWDEQILYGGNSL